ncbi:MAG: PAS domain-containing protein [Proteobacteria bacterium]|nr:PAS domain-containing protein [Pseudomonadota bacterium]
MLNHNKEHDLFLKIMEVGHIPMFFLSPELMIDKVSPYISNLFNIPHEKIIDQYYPNFCENYHLKDLVSPHLTTLKTCPKKVIEQAEIIPIKNDILNSYHIHWQLFSVLGEGEKIIGYALLGKDITTIYEQQMYLENIISCLPGSIYWKDRQGVYLGCNEVVVRMAGVNSSADIIGKTDFDLCWSNTAEGVTKDEQEIMNSGIAKELTPLFCCIS